MKLKGKASGEEFQAWTGRIKASRTMFTRVRRERRELENALALHDGLHGWSDFGSISDALENSDYHQQSVPLSFRFAVWLQAQTTGDPPVLKYPRDAAGDEMFATVMESLLLRVATEAGMFREWKGGIFDLCGFGSFCLWFGFHAEVTTAETAEGAKQGVEESTSRALRGDTAAHEAQDHPTVARALDTQLNDPVNQLALPAEAQLGLAIAATAQDAKAAEQIDAPRAVNVKQRSIWCRRLPVGTHVIWDHTVTDLRDARWVARRVTMRMEEARAFEGFGPGVRARLKPYVMSKDDPVEPVRDVEDKPLEGDENARFVFWEVFDKYYRTKHYVSEQMEGYLEADEAYPYADPISGEPALPGFFPCIVSAPLRHSGETPERTTGLPLISPGYPIQRLIVQFHDFAVSSARRHCVRQIEVPEDLPEDVRAMLESGNDGATIPRPAGIEPGDMARSIVFQGEAFKIVELIENLTDRWCALQGMPRTDLTGQPQAKTATAEGLSVQAGRNQADYVFRCIEEDMASGVELIRAMLKIGLYPAEKIAGLVGARNKALVEGWKSTSLDGDSLQLKLANRAQSEKAVRVKQLGDALGLVTAYLDPKTQLPKYDPQPIIEEIFLALDMGRPKEIVWTPEDLMARQAIAQMGGGESDGAAEDGPQKGPPKGGERERSQGPPTPAHVSGSARRA